MVFSGVLQNVVTVNRFLRRPIYQTTDLKGSQLFDQLERWLHQRRLTPYLALPALTHAEVGVQYIAFLRPLTHLGSEIPRSKTDLCFCRETKNITLPVKQPLDLTLPCTILQHAELLTDDGFGLESAIVENVFSQPNYSTSNVAHV